MSNIGCEAVALWLDNRFSNLFNQALVVSLFFSFKITSSLLSLVSELETHFQIISSPSWLMNAVLICSEHTKLCVLQNQLP